MHVNAESIPLWKADLLTGCQAVCIITKLIVGAETIHMIYTVTLNPSLDDFVSVPEFRLGKTNRTEEEHLVAGGKGINVSRVLTALGVPNTALGFAAGFTGEEIVRQIRKEGLCDDFIRLSKGCSRINVKLLNYEGTEINGEGPAIDDAALEQLMERIGGLDEEDILILAGSIPAGMPKTLYADLMKAAPDGVRIVVDAAGEALRAALPLHPFLIKPNLDELSELIQLGAGKLREELALQREICGEQSLEPSPLRHHKLENPSGPQPADVLQILAARIQKLGARNVLISMSGDGAVLLDADGKFHLHKVPAGELVNGVGAGDSMVAGFLAGLDRYGSYEDAFLMGIAAGSASAYQEGLAGQQEITDLYAQVKKEDGQ